MLTGEKVDLSDLPASFTHLQAIKMSCCDRLPDIKYCFYHNPLNSFCL